MASLYSSDHFLENCKRKISHTIKKVISKATAVAGKVNVQIEYHSVFINSTNPPPKA